MKKHLFLSLVILIVVFGFVTQTFAAVTETPVITSVIGTTGGTSPGYGYINSTGSTTVVVAGTAVGTSTVWAVLFDGGGHAATSTQVLGAAETSYSISVNGSSMDAGTVNVKVYALDTVEGNSTSTAAATTTTKDITAPTISKITMYTNNSSSTIAKVANVVTVSASSSETVGALTATIFGNSATNASTTQAYTTMTSSNTAGLATFSMTFSDLAGNAVSTTTINNGVLVYYYTVPTIYITGLNPLKCAITWMCADEGATALDSRGQSVTLSTLSTVSTSTVGHYARSYGGVDPAGNAATSTRDVYVVKKSVAPISVASTTIVSVTPSSSVTSVVPEVAVATTPTNNIDTAQTSTDNDVPITVIKVSGIKNTVKRQLLYGRSGADVKLVQTILSSDSTVYPEGLKTGYFGSLTRSAVQRFQVKYGIASAGVPGYGEVGPRTKAKLIEIYGE